MKTKIEKLLRLLGTPSGLAGGFLGATVAALMPGGNGVPGFGVGWLYGIVVGSLVRLFRVPPGAYPLVGLLAGPLPFALLMPTGASGDERGVLFIGLLAGLVLGLVEWAHARFRARTAGVPANPFLAPNPRE